MVRGVTDAPRTPEVSATGPHLWWDKPLKHSRAWWAVNLGIDLASAALCLVEQRRLTRARRGWYRVALAGLAAGAFTVGVARERGWWESGDAGWFTGTLATLLAVADPMERLDARIVAALEERGIRNPRRLEAAGWLAWAVISGVRSFPRRVRAAENTTEFRPLSPEVRALLERILGAIDDYGAKELLAQLEGALEARCEHGCAVELEVHPDAPRSRIAHYDFPVALCGDDEGAAVSVVLRITDGCLGELEILREGLSWEEGLTRVEELDLELMDWF